MRTKFDYRRHYEKWHNVAISPYNHIHHYDGDSENNEISNLVECTPEKHKQYHLDRGDVWNARMCYWANLASLKAASIRKGKTVDTCPIVAATTIKRTDFTLYRFYHPDVGVCTTWVQRLVKTYGLDRSATRQLAKGRYKSFKGWTVL